MSAIPGTGSILNFVKVMWITSNVTAPTGRSVPPLSRKEEKNGSLDFPFEEQVYIEQHTFQRAGDRCRGPWHQQRRHGFRHARGWHCLGRHFCRFPREKDSLTPRGEPDQKGTAARGQENARLWARANGINDDIAVKTAKFIIDVAVLYNADVIVFEHLDLKGRKPRLQKAASPLMESPPCPVHRNGPAHRLGIRVSHVNAWNTSRLAFDGSGASSGAGSLKRRAAPTAYASSRTGRSTTAT